MNFYEMRQEFDRIFRSSSDETFTDYRDQWLNRAWRILASLYTFPALKRTEFLDSKEGVQVYPLPLDYDGIEAMLWYKPNTSAAYYRLDPATEEVLALAYERRSGSMGPVKYYDITEPVGTDTYVLSGCGLTNNSATVTCTSAEDAHEGLWVVFAPTVDEEGVTRNPGDYAYKITGVSAGVSFTLDRAYRGPSGIFTARVKPSEQQQFIVYGVPTADIEDAFQLRYYAVPRRLYNDSDTPEWPNVGEAIVYMALSIAYDFLHDREASTTWFGRAMSRLTSLQRRRESTKTLVTDLLIGSAASRSTTVPGYLSPNRVLL
ncbi:MAG: hypothetical protein QXT73_01340 [Candidatus Methanomethylicaceae archaeon]